MASQEQKDRLSQAAALINSILSPSAVQNIAASATVQPPVTARHVSVEGEITTVFSPWSHFTNSNVCVARTAAIKSSPITPKLWIVGSSQQEEEVSIQTCYDEVLIISHNVVTIHGTL